MIRIRNIENVVLLHNSFYLSTIGVTRDTVFGILVAEIIVEIFSEIIQRVIGFLTFRTS